MKWPSSSSHSLLRCFPARFSQLNISNKCFVLNPPSHIDNLTRKWGGVGDRWGKPTSRVLIPGAAAAIFALKWKSLQAVRDSWAHSKDTLTPSQSAWMNGQVALNDSYFLHLVLWTQLWAKLTRTVLPPLLSAASDTSKKTPGGASLNNTVSQPLSRPQCGLKEKKLIHSLFTISGLFKMFKLFTHIAIYLPRHTAAGYLLRTIFHPKWIPPGLNM